MFASTKLLVYMQVLTWIAFENWNSGQHTYTITNIKYTFLVMCVQEMPCLDTELRIMYHCTYDNV